MQSGSAHYAYFSEVRMGKLKSETQRCVEQDWLQSQEIVECGEKRLEEAKSFAHASIFNPLEDIEAIDIDDITALMACGKKFTVEELVEQFGVPIDVAKSLSAPCDCMDIAKAIVEAENTEAVVSIFENADEYEAVESSNSDLPINEQWEYCDEELARIVYKLEHAFD